MSDLGSVGHAPEEFFKGGLKASENTVSTIKGMQTQPLGFTSAVRFGWHSDTPASNP